MTKSNVVPFFTAVKPDDVLEQAKGQFDSVFVIGWDHNDTLDGRASENLTKKSDIIYLIEHFKNKLLNGDYDELH